MAVPNLTFNVTANTARALADFNKFSRSLDNKFLISGLKLDVVRNALGQINRDFQRAIGEQGMASASSLRAAQNQAALLTQTFKGFASESALAITNNIGTALNNVVVKTGGTMQDVQKSLLASPFISTRLGEDVRIGLTKGILDFQKNIRRAGLGDNFGGVAQQFLMGNRTTMQMIQSGNSLEMFLGSELIKKGAGTGEIGSPEMRTRLLELILGDEKIAEQLEIAAKRTAGFRIILEDLNTYLFNPEAGIFGYLRKVVDSAGKSTTMFDQVYRLVDQTFGKNGMFAAFFRSLQEVFGYGDPLKPFIDGIQFMTKVFESITNYFNSDGFKGILGNVKVIVDSLTSIFTGIYREVTQGTFNSSDITYSINEIGTSIREYVKTVGEGIRNGDDDEIIGFVTSIAGTLFTEVGKTTIVLIKELLLTLVSKVPEIASAALPAINNGINTLLEEIFGPLSKIVKPILATLPGPIGMVARASMITDLTGGQGRLGLIGALAPMLLAGGGGFAGAGMRALTSTGRGATAFRTLSASLGASMVGLDPTMGLLAGFAPQILGPFLGRTGQQINRFNILGALYSYGSSAVNLSRSLGGRAASFLGNSSATLSRYLGAVGPVASSFANRISTPISQASIFLRSQQSQFMAGFRPPFPNVAVGGPTTRAYGAGQFFRNLPNNLSSLTGSFVSNLQGLGRSIAGFGRTAGSNIATVTKLMAGNLTTMGKVILASGINASLEMQRVGRMFMLGASGQALSTRSSKSVQLGMAFRRFGPGLLAGGSIVAGSQLLGRSVGGETGKQISGLGTVLGSGLSGAATGAMIGSAIPVIGTAAGAVIGGIIGGIAPLMDKGVREGVSKFISGVGNSLGWVWNNITKWIQETFNWLTKGLTDVLKGAINGLISAINVAISAFTFMPRLIVNAVQSLFNQLPKNLQPEWAKENITKLNSVTSFQIPIPFYSGKDYFGPAMSVEARMSGRQPMVVNDGEFVIPRDGFPTLAGLVGQNLKTSGSVNQSSQPIHLNVSLNITTHSITSNPDELVNALRDPVYRIISDAWDEAYKAQRVHRTKVS